jgi:hypothetical protein
MFMSQRKGLFLILLLMMIFSPFGIPYVICFQIQPASATTPIIIDHTCTDFSKIPDYWLEQAKLLKVHYAHTSHGSQINTGLSAIEIYNTAYGIKYSFARRCNGTEGLPPVENPPALRMYDGNPPKTYITPNDYWQGESALDRTRAVVSTGHYDISMWAWCGQLSSASESYVNDYLSAMAKLESEYPNVKFVYFTGHLDASGPTGTLHQNNERIRNYCRANHKILFDFADIERYNPDGEDFLDKGTDDYCNYSGGNWADQWITAHPDSELAKMANNCGNCAHSKKLNCILKGRAFWWLLARIAGWNGTATQAIVTSLGSVSSAQCRDISLLRAEVKNTGSSSLPSNSKVWFYVTGPSWTGTHWVGSDSGAGLTVNSSKWYSYNWAIPASFTGGSYTYWARVYTGTSAISPWSTAQGFDVSCP